MIVMGITRTTKTLRNKILRYNTFDSIVIVRYNIIVVISTYVYMVFIYFPLDCCLK